MIKQYLIILFSDGKKADKVALEDPTQFEIKFITRVVRPLVKSVYQKISFLISQPKHVVGTQKNRLNETVLLSTQNICSN